MAIPSLKSPLWAICPRPSSRERIASALSRAALPSRVGIIRVMHDCVARKMCMMGAGAPPLQRRACDRGDEHDAYEERAMVFWLTQAASWLSGKVPRWLRLAIAGSLTTLVYYAWVSKRRVTIANMARILDTTPNDPRARQAARDSWRNYGRYLSDFFYLPNTTSPAVLARMRDVSGEPGVFGRIDEALARGKGLIIVTAHFGAFDIAGVLVAARMPLAVIADSFTDPRMDQMIQSQRSSFGLSVIRAEKSPRPILRALKDNQAVAIVADRPLPAGEGTPITFFGARCYVPSGPAQLALLSGAAMGAGFCYYDERFSDDVLRGAQRVDYS